MAEKNLRVQNFDDLSSSPSRQWLTLSQTWHIVTPGLSQWAGSSPVRWL